MRESVLAFLKKIQIAIECSGFYSIGFDFIESQSAILNSAPEKAFQDSFRIC